MEDRQLEFKDYKSRLDEIVRKGRDINFVDISNDIEITIDFFLSYYSDKKYQVRFTENERQDIENYSRKPFVDAVNQILATTNWQSASSDSYRSDIQQAYRRLVQQGYLTRVEAARASEDKSLKDFEKLSEKLLAEQQAAVDAAKSAAAEAFERLEEQRADIDKKIRQIDTKAAKAEKSLARQVSSENGKVFLDSSSGYGKIARLWLKALICVVCAVSLLLAWLFVELVVTPNVFTSNLVFSGLKISAIVVLIYLIQITTRNYNTNKHLQTINHQRAMVVSFINTFINSVDGEVYKDYLLTYAAKTVFDHGETGFISRNYGAGSGGEDGLDTILGTLTKFKQ